MKFALINNEKTEASKGAKGFCPVCGSELIARCGEVKIHHWAHKGNRNCDPWWENESEWHRSWKGEFPEDWQEVVHFDKSGEKHIADVKTPSGYAFEFQNSYLKSEERRSRNAFYRKLVWIVNGTRRKTDITQFQKIIKESTIIRQKPQILKIHFPEECRLLREWHDSGVLVFFDFQEPNDKKQAKLWFLFPKISNGEAYLSFFTRDNFIELHNNNKFDEIITNQILPLLKSLASNHQKVYHQPQIMLSPQRQLQIMRQRRHRRL